ncbi:class I SAM-dependent methyltransferase [Streptomyces sp. HNM0663]|uniref:Class I SAM-dependent methyltransferase n=1 Tax=Streptomyces chengmaiensis TaxID=3040919 RepID=A0ABT6HJH4_9ACTN|nr:class I SAM-dependent methyltransferase [Streptomyces chengmaiensis]MDH2388442.1 class I SAM-dependent methyltransferase [Streptomyces chengmaiensis]
MSTGNLLTDHPELYEERFPDPDRLAARWAEDTLRRHGAGPRVLDIGCGTGRDAAWLHHHAGRRVTGIDTAEAMLAHARCAHPGPDYHRADMRDFDLKAAFDAVVCLDSALLYCHTNDDLTAFLDRCRAHLTPGGLLIAEMRNGAFFLGNTELLGGPRTASFGWRGTTHTSHTTLWIDHGAQLLRRRRAWSADDGTPPQEQHSAWRLLFPQELRYFLTTAGFEVLDLYDHPGPRTEPPWREGDSPHGTTSSDRLHLVARLPHPNHPPLNSQHSDGDTTP